MILFVNILLIAGIVLLGYKGTRKNPLKNYYLPGLSIKIVAGISVGLVYSLYYTNGDTFAMYNEGIRLKEAAIGSLDQFISIYFKSDFSHIEEFAYPIQPRAAFMAKILGILAFLTNDNYWLSSVYISIFSFWGFWLLATSLHKMTGFRLLAVIPTLFFPSIVFWSSGILKESVAIAAMAGVIAISLRGYLRYKLLWTHWAILIAGLYLVSQLKYYYAATLVVAIISLFVTRSTTSLVKRWYWELASSLLVFSFLMIIGSLTHPNFWLSRMMDVIVNNYYQYVALSRPENVVVFNNFSPNLSSFLFHAPKALFVGLFSPLYSGLGNPLKVLSIIENWVLLCATLFGLRYFKMPETSEMRVLLFTTLLFIVITAVLLTFSAPNYGTLVRYKIGYLIAFVSILSAVIIPRMKRT